MKLYPLLKEASDKKIVKYDDFVNSLGDSIDATGKPEMVSDFKNRSDGLHQIWCTPTKDGDVYTKLYKTKRKKGIFSKEDVTKYEVEKKGKVVHSGIVEDDVK